MRAKLKQLEGSYAVVRLAPHAAVPGWADGNGFSTVSRSEEELSIVCRDERVPDEVESDRGWTCFKSIGPVGLDQAGFVLSVIRPLSENGIGIFVTSTFDGDHFMVKDADITRARSFLRAAGHTYAT